jgi:hypothetical protein
MEGRTLTSTEEEVVDNIAMITMDPMKVMRAVDILVVVVRDMMVMHVPILIRTVLVSIVTIETLARVGELTVDNRLKRFQTNHCLRCIRKQRQ